MKKQKEFKDKGVDVIAVLAVNDPFVMSGWLRFNGIKDEVCLIILNGSYSIDTPLLRSSVLLMWTRNGPAVSDFRSIGRPWDLESELRALP